MPHINRIRVNNVKYNFGTQYYDDFIMRFSGKNTIYDLANGGGKSVLMLLLLQNLIPNCTLDEKQPVEKLFRSGNGNTTIHSLIEWKLNPCHVRNGFQYMTTGFCARKAKGASGEEEESGADRASIDYFNYCIFYRQFNDNDLKNLPLSNGKERMTYLGLRSYLQELEKKDFHVEVKIFDRKGDYQNFISHYGLFESEWEIIRGINKTEGHVRTYFETNYRTTRKVVEDLLIEEIIEKSFYHKTGTDKETGEMANTLLDLKDQLVLLSQKKNEIHYYDRQILLLSEFAARVGSLQGMYAKKQGLEEQLVRTYHTTLKRRTQKEQAHEALSAREGQLQEQKQELSRQIETAKLQKKEQELLSMELQMKEQDARIEEASKLNEKKRARLEARECDNHYLNYLEYEKEYLAAKKAVEEILNGEEASEDSLFAMANELNSLLDEKISTLGEEIAKLQEQSAKLEQEKNQQAEKEKRLAVKLEALETSVKQTEQARFQVQEAVHEISVREKLLYFEDPKTQCVQAKKDLDALEERLLENEQESVQCAKEIYGTELQNRAVQKEEGRITSELEALNQTISGYGELKNRMDQLIAIYGGTYESVENIIFQQQKELVLAHQKAQEEKRAVCALLEADAEGIPVAQKAEVSAVLEEIVRYYDPKAVSGYDYLMEKEAPEREFLLDHYPVLPYGIVTEADLERIAQDHKLWEKNDADGLLPLVSRNALEREQELTVDTAMIFAGKTVNAAALKERLSRLEELFAGNYEKERVLKQDYDFVKQFLQQCEECEQSQERYDSLKAVWKELSRSHEKGAGKIRQLSVQQEQLQEERTQLLDEVKEAGQRLSHMQDLAKLEQELAELESRAKELQAERVLLGTQLETAGQDCRQAAEAFAELCDQTDMKQQALKQVLESKALLKGYVNEKSYPESGLSWKELETAFLGKKAAYEQKNSDVSDKQKLAASYEKAMEQQREQLELLGYSLEVMAQKEQQSGCVRTDMEEMLVLKKDAFSAQNHLVLLENEKKTLEVRLHQATGSILHARQMLEEAYGEIRPLEIPSGQLETFAARTKEQCRSLEQQLRDDQITMRDLEEQCYALRAMAQDMERMMKSAGITPGNASECLETGVSLKEQYEELRSAYERIVKEERQRLEAVEKEKQQLTATLEKMDAYELAREIERNLVSPENEQEIRAQMDSLRSVTDCLELEKSRIGKDMASLQELKDRFEAQCLQNCLNIREELDRLQKLSKISMDDQMISMITLQIPYIKEELYENAMSEYIDRITGQVERFETQAERLNYIRSQLAFKRLFSVIVTNMDAIRLTLYKRERMKEQSRYLKYEEAVGSTGQSQGIYIQFLVAVINYISSINSGNADPLELKKVVFIDNPFGAAKDVYIWEPIFQLLKANNVQLIVPARGATPAITGHFEVNYILGQKLIDGRQQTVVVDYRSQTDEKELEYAALEYEQETFDFINTPL